MTSINTIYDFQQSAKLHQPIVGEILIKRNLSDFVVREHLAFVPSGSGEHVYIHIEKRGMSTGYVRELLAKFAERHQRDIGYAGLKDRQALTSQWFSIYLPGGDNVEWHSFEQFVASQVSNSVSALRVLSVLRHNKKLRVGAHKANDFEIVLRASETASGNHHLLETLVIDALSQRIDALAQTGFPNYFGEQRFGVKGGNIAQAIDMFLGQKRVAKKQRGFLISAARSLLFNELLSARVVDDTWCRYTDGDVLMLNGSQSIFRLDPASEREPQLRDIDARLRSGDVNVSGVLYGRDYQACDGSAGELERVILQRYPELISGLNADGIDSGRRAFRVFPAQCSLDRQGDALSLHFRLPKGSFATAMLRELVSYTDFTMG